MAPEKPGPASPYFCRQPRLLLFQSGGHAQLLRDLRHQFPLVHLLAAHYRPQCPRYGAGFTDSARTDGPLVPCHRGPVGPYQSSRPGFFRHDFDYLWPLSLSGGCLLPFFWLIALALVIIGIGFALFTAPNNNAIMGAVTPKYYGAASSVVSTVRLIGQVLSVAIITLILSQSGASAASDWLAQHIQQAFIVFTILCAIGIVPSAARSK